MFKWLRRKKTEEETQTVNLFEEAIEKLKVEFNERIAKLTSTNTELQCKVSSLEKTNREYLSKLREQNDADLLLTALRVAVNIVNSKSEERLRDEFYHLQQQRNMYSQMLGQRSISGWWRDFGGLRR